MSAPVTLKTPQPQLKTELLRFPHHLLEPEPVAVHDGRDSGRHRRGLPDFHPGRLLYPDNVAALVQQNAYVLILAIGIVMVIVAQHIDTVGRIGVAVPRWAVRHHDR